MLQEQKRPELLLAAGCWLLYMLEMHEQSERDGHPPSP